MRILTAVLGLAATLATAQIGLADTFSVTGSGTWNATDVQSTPYSQDGATWQFSFVVPSPIANNPTQQATDFSYLLNGVTVPGTLTEVQFFPAGDGGMFDLHISGTTLSLEGTTTDVGSTLTLVPGTFATKLSIAEGTVMGSGTVTLLDTSVPEPPSFVLLGSALLMGAGWLYFREG